MHQTVIPRRLSVAVISGKHGTHLTMKPINERKMRTVWGGCDVFNAEQKTSCLHSWEVKQLALSDQ
jgi:hypothetical protein